MRKSYKIALVEDEGLFRAGLRLLLKEHADIELCCEASNGQEFLDHLEETSDIPEVVLMDLQMPVLNGIECTKILHAKYPQIHIIILSSHYNASFITNMIELGASAYMPKNEPPDEVATTIRNVADKGFHYNDYVVKILRDHMLYGKSKNEADPNELLNVRELEVLILICEEYTTKEIAEHLFLSPRTIEGYRNNLLAKTDSKNTAGLVLYAIEHKVVKMENYRDFDI